MEDEKRKCGFCGKPDCTIKIDTQVVCSEACQKKYIKFLKDMERDCPHVAKYEDEL